MKINENTFFSHKWPDHVGIYILNVIFKYKKVLNDANISTNSDKFRINMNFVDLLASIGPFNCHWTKGL